MTLFSFMEKENGKNLFPRISPYSWMHRHTGYKSSNAPTFQTEISRCYQIKQTFTLLLFLKQPDLFKQDLIFYCNLANTTILYDILSYSSSSCNTPLGEQISFVCCRCALSRFLQHEAQRRF
jgi:hypothetical protein